MTRYLAPLTAALLATGAACAFAQTSAPGGSAGTSPGATTAPRALSSPSSSGTSDAAAETVPPVPQPSENPNTQVPPSAATLPGGGDVPITSGSNAEEAVPIYGAQDDSAGSIREAEERSRGDDCGGQGTRMASGTGTTSAETTGRNCAENPGAENALGTMPIMGSSGTIDVRDTGP